MHLRRVVFVETVASILGELFDGVVVCEDIAMNATHERNGNFQDRNEEMIRGFANCTGAHQGHHGNTARWRHDLVHGFANEFPEIETCVMITRL